MERDSPFDIATCMYYAGVDPFTKRPVDTAKNLTDRKMQRALMQFFKPENYFEVREALQKAGRMDLIGSGCDALIPANPPREALRARMEKANKTLSEGKFVHQIDGGGGGRQARPNNGGGGYRPDRKTAKRQEGKRKGR